MKKYTAFIYSLVLIAFIASCNPSKKDSNGIRTTIENEIRTIPLEIHEVYKLDEQGSDSPALTIDIMLSVLEANDNSATENMNRTIAYTLFESETSDLSAACNTFTANCRSEYSELRSDYINRRENAPFFNNYYNISSEITNGYNGILNYLIFNEIYTGGAHPNSFYTALNFDPSTGEEIVLDDILKNDYETRLTQELLVALADHFKVSPVTEIVVQGYLINDFYISNNFILGKDKITFIYNRYDIAPYAAGEIMLDIEYKNIKDILK